MKLIKLSQENNQNMGSANEFSYETILKFSQELMPEWSSQLALAFADVDFEKSIAASVNGELVGILLVSDRQVKDVLEEAEIVEQKTDLDSFQTKTGMEGVLFLIHPKSRGTGLDKKIVSYFKSKTSCNYMMASVYESLNTHNYWKRMGFQDVATMDDGDRYKLYIKTI